MTERLKSVTITTPTRQLRRLMTNAEPMREREIQNPTGGSYKPHTFVDRMRQDVVIVRCCQGVGRQRHYASAPRAEKPRERR